VGYSVRSVSSRTAVLNAMARVNPRKALPAEVVSLRHEGVPYPSWYVGPLYTGNGGAAAGAALDEQLKGLEDQRGDAPAAKPSETDVSTGNSAVPADAN
jgi:hypothetical protein